MKLAIQSYEANGYHDSDGYMIYLDTDTMRVRKELWWTTRGGMTSPEYNRDPKEWTPVRVAVVKFWLAQKFIHQYRVGEYHDINKPNDVKPGSWVELTEEAKNAKKEATTVDCFKCDGTGNWVNPRNANDMRDCFACKGSGKKTSYKRAKGWIYWAKGTRFKVKDVQAYGTFYRNGYNKPSRHNRTAVGFTEAGEFVRAPLTKLRLSDSRLSESEMVKKATRVADSLAFVAAYGGAWCDSGGNFIGKALKKVA